MVVALVGLLEEIHAAKRRHDVAARLDYGENHDGNRLPRHKRPTENSGPNYHSSTWHGTESKAATAPGSGLHPMLKSNLSEAGCPGTAPTYARGANYDARVGRNQCTQLYKRIHGDGSTEEVLYNPNNPQMARLQRAHETMGYPTGYQQPTQGQGQPVSQQQQMQQPQQAQQPHTNPNYTPPQSYVHPENQSAQSGSTPTAACGCTGPCTGTNCTNTESIPTPVETPAPAETQPVSTGTVVTPPEIETVSGSGYFWKFSVFTILVTIAAALYYVYQKHFAKRQKRRRAPRRWETIRAKVMEHHYHQNQPRSNYGDMESGYGRMNRQHSVDNQVAMSSYQAPAWERVSKGSKFV